MRRSLAIAGAAALACAAVGTPLRAQGSGIDQQSACMTGRVGAGVASPCDDASGVYFSPAGLAMRGGAVSAGVSLIRAGGDFRYDPASSPPGQNITRETETVPVPQAFLSYKVNPRLAAAIGVFAPFGLGLEWPVCEVNAAAADCSAQPNFEGRYTGYDNSLRGLYIQPTVAYQVVPGTFSIGAGLDYVRMNIEIHQRADAPNLGLQNVDIADVELKGDGTGITGHVGALLKLAPNAWLGARYLHSVSVDLDGDADFTQDSTGTVFDTPIGAQFVEGGPLGDQAIGTTVELPAQIVVGLSYRPMEPLNLLFDYQWTQWSNFDQFDIDFANASATDRTLLLDYRNTNTFRFAAEYAASEALALRAGYRFNTAATPRASPLLPEGERNYYTAGLGYRFTRALSVDLAYQYINQPDRRGTVRPGGGQVGVYGATGQVFGFTLAYHFGGQ